MSAPTDPGPRFDDPGLTLGSGRLWNAPAAILLGFTFAIMAEFLISAVASPFGSSVNHPSPAVSIIQDYGFDAAFVAAALYFAWTGGAGRRPKAEAFGYRRVGIAAGLGAFVLGGGSYYALTFLYGSALNLHDKDKLPSELGVQHHTAALVAATVFVCVCAPMAEEFFFRGFFFGTLRRMQVTIGGRDAGPWIAALATAILFGFAHLGSAPAEYLVPLGFLGFVLCLIRWWTGSLYPCMALHAFNNALALGVNQEHWSAPEIVALTAGSWLVIGLITIPLARGARPVVGWHTGR